VSDTPRAIWSLPQKIASTLSDERSSRLAACRLLPGIATTALYAFLFSWTEFLAALIFLTNDSLFTLPVALINVESGNYGAVNYGLLLSGAVIAMIPCIVVYVSLQRFYVRGLVSGALKG
jgi:multiple sugar transport system permease protein